MQLGEPAGAPSPRLRDHNPGPWPGAQPRCAAESRRSQCAGGNLHAAESAGRFPRAQNESSSTGVWGTSLQQRRACVHVQYSTALCLVGGLMMSACVRLQGLRQACLRSGISCESPAGPGDMRIICKRHHWPGNILGAGIRRLAPVKLAWTHYRWVRRHKH